VPGGAEVDLSGFAETVEDYVAVRGAIERGEATWLDLARFFTDDAVYIDPAWGRIQGIDAIRAFLVESMTGLEDWRFPIELTAVSGRFLLVRWAQVLPSGHRQSGVSTLRYAGGGRFDYEEDLLNMAHVLEDLQASGWRPGPGFANPPAHPDRDVSLPG
jgi:limonene-1,2-epoxide hydrolase